MMTNENDLPDRVAIYFAPAVGSPWWEAGSQWLGRCAASGRVFEQVLPEGVPREAFQALTAEPRRYGWHATLKAPFQLAPGCSLQALREALRVVCARTPRFTLPPLAVRVMGNFLALRPTGPSAALDAVAAACVTELHALAAPLSPGELARRRRASLMPEQDALLQAWGYAWVLDHFRFHFSLTGELGPVPQEMQASVMQAARERFEGLPPCEFDSLSLFVERRRGGDFELLEQLELAR